MDAFWNHERIPCLKLRQPLKNGGWKMSFLLGVGLFSEALAVISRAVIKQIKHDRRTGWPQEKKQTGRSIVSCSNIMFGCVFYCVHSIALHKSCEISLTTAADRLDLPPKRPQDAVFFGWGYWKLKISCRHGGDDCILSKGQMVC